MARCAKRVHLEAWNYNYNDLLKVCNYNDLLKVWNYNYNDLLL